MKWEKKHIDFLRMNIKGTSIHLLTQKFNDCFNLSVTENQIKSLTGRKKLNSGVDCRFKPCHSSFNKGKKWDEFMSKEGQEQSLKTTFKKGHKLNEERPIGSERIDTDGYIMIKVASPNVWKLKHRLMWELEHGEIPSDSYIIMLDQNKLNTDISNLIMVKKADMARLNNLKLTTDPGANLALITVAKIMNKCGKLKRGEK